MDGAGVTQREGEVLSLIAGHLTNAEIAERLFLSVRTVESHVASLMRKLGAADRRGLARQAETLGLLRARPAAQPPWPVPASLFVGREAETAALRALLREHRLVTVTGPGGVGKTRLVLRAMERGWFVDLSRVTAGGSVLPAVAAVVGAVEPPGGTLEDALGAAVRDAEGVLVLDNCEHLLLDVEHVTTLLLTAAPGLRLVATSRAPMRSPEEWVYEMPALSPDDAVHLFRSRAAAAGGVVPDDDRVRDLCARLEHLALAIELAAARYPSLGTDGLDAALEDPLELLGGDGRRSLRATLAWSVDLLDDEALAAFAALSVFTTQFSAVSASAVAMPGRSLPAAARVLVTLADQHLLHAEPGHPTRYRFQEVVRQYAAEQLGNASREVADRHLAWATTELEVLSSQQADATWCLAFDALAVEVRAALTRRLDRGVGEAFAEQLVRRGLLEESQRLFEELAACHDHGRTHLLRLAAAVAAARLVGDDTMRLLDAASASGGPEEAADALAWSVIFAAFHPGMMATAPVAEDVRRRLTTARQLAPAGSPSEVTVAAASAMCRPQNSAQVTAAARAAADQAAALGLPLVASAALDCVCAHELTQGEYGAALASVEARGALLDPLPFSATTAYPFNDYLLMGCEVSLAAGDLTQALAFAERLEALPCYRDYAHPALARRFQVDALSKNCKGAGERADRFLDSWERSGKHPASTLAVGAYAMAYLQGVLGDSRKREHWQEVTTALLDAPVAFRIGWAPTLDAMLLLHRGQPDAARAVLAASLDDPEWSRSTTQQMWRPWYAAAWAEAAALTGEHDLTPAVTAAQGNTLASARVTQAIRACF